MRKHNTQYIFRVGIFMSVMVLIFAITIFSIGKENNLFVPRETLKAHLPHVANLKPGSYVEFKGIKIGVVEAVDILSEDTVEIKLDVIKEKVKWIKKDSLVSINSAGLVGDKFLEITNGTAESASFSAKTDVLYSGDTLDFKKMINHGETIASKVERILDKFDSILVNMEDGKQLNQSIHSIAKITDQLSKAPLQSSIKRLDNNLKRLDQILARIENGPGTMNSLIYDESIHNDLKALLGGAQRNKLIKYMIRETIKGSKTPKTKTQDE